MISIKWNNKEKKKKRKLRSSERKKELNLKEFNRFKHELTHQWVNDNYESGAEAPPPPITRERHLELKPKGHNSTSTHGTSSDQHESDSCWNQRRSSSCPASPRLSSCPSESPRARVLLSRSWTGTRPPETKPEKRNENMNSQIAARLLIRSNIDVTFFDG
jgi:hypothetical protein